MSDERFERWDGGFLGRYGPARTRGEARCDRKLCFTSTTVEVMADLLYELSLREDCWAVKLDDAVGPHGMVRGRCFLTSEDAVIEVWKRYKVTDRLLCTVQDDTLVAEHR